MLLIISSGPGSWLINLWPVCNSCQSLDIASHFYVISYTHLFPLWLSICFCKFKRLSGMRLPQDISTFLKTPGYDLAETSVWMPLSRILREWSPEFFKVLRELMNAWEEWGGALVSTTANAFEKSRDWPSNSLFHSASISWGSWWCGVW